MVVRAYKLDRITGLDEFGLQLAPRRHKQHSPLNSRLSTPRRREAITAWSSSLRSALAIVAARSLEDFYRNTRRSISMTCEEAAGMLARGDMMRRRGWPAGRQERKSKSEPVTWFFGFLMIFFWLLANDIGNRL